MNILVLQHIAIEHPGCFRDFMDTDNVTWHPVEVDEGEPIPAPDDFDALLVMGGPMDVWQEIEHPWLVEEKSFIREAVVEHGLPYLGFCLGHQLLAEALGGKVGPMEVSEVGVLDVHLTESANEDPLFKSMPRTCKGLQWHSAEVKQLPPHSEILASSPLCEIQAFKTHTHAYGVQYHMEQTPDTVPEWGCVPEYSEALEKTLGNGALATMKIEVDGLLPQFTANAKILYDNFMSIVRAREIA